MFLKISASVWVIIFICILAAFIYMWIDQKISQKERGGAFYGALGVCLGIAAAATVISKWERYVGAPMLALIMGIILVNTLPDSILSHEFKAGTSYIGKKYLSLGIVCLGATLAFTDLFSAMYALPLIIFNIFLSFAAAYLIGGKLLHVSTNTCTLVGGGTCVCGGTAIAALSSIIKSKEAETAYAMTAIFLFDLFACLSYPYLAVRLGLQELQFGFLAGTAINDTSSVVAAQETFAALKGLENYALPATIKVVRTSMIIVLALVFSLVSVRKNMEETYQQRNSVPKVLWRAFPKFILFFAAMVMWNTVMASTAAESEFYVRYFRPFFSNGYKFFVTLALAGVGFKIKFRDLFTKGLKPVILGGCTWFCLFCSSLLFSICFVK